MGTGNLKLSIHRISKIAGSVAIALLWVFFVSLSGGPVSSSGTDILPGRNCRDVAQDDTLKPDFTSVYIVTPEGKLLKKIRYDPDSLMEYINYIKGYVRSYVRVGVRSKAPNSFRGDFNGDGIKDTATIATYKVYDPADDYSVNWAACECIIEFSSRNIKPLIVEGCTEGAYRNEGDLNYDGRDEIGILPGWPSGSCRQYEVYTYRDSKWVQICEPIQNTHNMRQVGIDLIEKSPQQGYVIIRQSIESYYEESERKIPFKYVIGSCCAWSNVVERTVKLK